MPAAARLNDPTSHGPTLTPGPGSPDVLIGMQPAWRALPASVGAAVDAISNSMDSFMKKPQMTPADAASDLAKISQNLTQGGAKAAAAGAPGAAGAAGGSLATLNTTNATLSTTWGTASAAPGGQPAANIAYTEGIKAAAAAAASAVMSAMAGLSDMHLCPIPCPVPPHGPGFVTKGSATVLINNLPPARQNDKVMEACGGADPIAMGCPTVEIGDEGDGSSSPPPASSTAAVAAAQAAAEAASQAASTASALAQAAAAGTPLIQITPPCRHLPRPVGKHEITIQVVDDRTDRPIPGVMLDVTLPDGKTESRVTDGSGTVYYDDIEQPGACTIACKLKDARLTSTLDFVAMGEVATTSTTDTDADAEPDEQSGPRGRIIADIEEHKVKTGETLSGLAATGGLTTEQLTQFNWGVSDSGAVNEHLHNDVGSTHKDAAGNFVLDDSDDPGMVYVPKPFKQTGLMTDQVHVVRALEIAPKRNMHECVCIPGVTFEFDKSFIRPNIVDHMKKLEKAIDDFKAKNNAQDPRLIVFGHTDRVGGEQYNKELSDRRAKSSYAFVTNQPDIWEELFNQEHWGTSILQTILRDLGHDPGASDGKQGSQTTAAIKSYQTSRGLAPDGVAGPATRRQMFLDYMSGKHDVRVTDSQFFAPKFMGCGEFNPLLEPNDNELANGGRGRPPGNEPNRRVVFYLFKRPPRTIPCKLRNIGPCKTEIAKPGERENPLHTCAFYDGIAKQCNCEQRFEEIRIRLFDWLGRALPEAPFEVTLGGKTNPRSKADENGDIVLQNVAPGTARIKWSRPESMRNDPPPPPPGPQSGEIDFVPANGAVQKVTLTPGEDPEFEFEGEVFINLPEAGEAEAAEESAPAAGLDQDAARKRLNNMGYSTADGLRDNIRAFQRDCGDDQTGQLQDAEGKLTERHDRKCEPPGNSSKK